MQCCQMSFFLDHFFAFSDISRPLFTKKLVVLRLPMFQDNHHIFKTTFEESGPAPGNTGVCFKKLSNLQIILWNQLYSFMLLLDNNTH